MEATSEPSVAVVGFDEATSGFADSIFGLMEVAGSSTGSFVGLVLAEEGSREGSVTVLGVFHTVGKGIQSGRIIIVKACVTFSEVRVTLSALTVRIPALSIVFDSAKVVTTSGHEASPGVIATIPGFVDRIRKP
ncbi:MAG TPA: hypothetical protein VFF73_41535 [Planctomycetota bacterium]|nr:hypothetical protein [Planctomycetota bacterium]